MPQSVTQTRDQIAADQIQFILRQDWFQPETIRSQIQALRQLIASGKSTDVFSTVPVDDQQVPLAKIQQVLARLNQALGFRIDPQIFNILNLDHLNRLEQALTELQPPAQPTTASIPPDLKALVEQFEKANQAAISAQSKRQGWSPEELSKQIAFQDQITVQMRQVRRYTLSQLEWAITNSTALENLAASLGVRPQDVKNLALQRAKTSVDKNITALTFRQARSLITDPVQLAAYYTARLKADVMADDLLILAAVDKDPKTKQKYLDAALKKTKEAATAETEKVKPAIESAAKNLAEHPTVRKTAQTDAAAAVKQVETVSLGRQPNQQLSPAKAARLAEALARHPDNPDRQERIIRSALGATSAQAKVIRGQLAPQINQLATSTKKLNPLLAADPDGIAADALRRPYLFPKPFVDALKSGKITDAEVAEIFQMSRLLGVPADAVILRRWGVNAKDLASSLQAGKKWLWIIPMGHVDPKDATVAKLSDLAAAQKQLSDFLKTPPPLLPGHTATQFLKTSRAASRSVKFGEFLDKINPFLLPSALSYNFPPLSAFDNAAAGFSAKWRVDLGPLDGAINFLNSLGDTARSLPDFATRPFRAVGSAIGNTIINPVKTWANTQIKSGLARAGAWLAKKGVTEAAKKIGAAIIGKGTAALLAQGIPVAGQIFAAALIGGDILKFLWDHKDKVGMFLGGMFLWGQMMLGNLIHLISSLGTIGLSTGIGALLGTIFIPIPFVGTAIGAGLGFGAGLMINAAGGLGAALSGLGSALGSAAAGLSSFIGALTAPSLMAGVGGTLAAVGLGGIGLTAALVIFFIQPTINSALFVPSDSDAFPPGGEYIPPEILGSCPIPGGFNLCGSLGSPYQTGCTGGHGSNEYWGGQGGDACRWGLPSSDGARCTTNPFPGSFCYNSASICIDYGFASDFTYTGISKPERCGKPIYLVSLNGQTLDWTVVWTRDNLGGVGRSGLIRATDGTSVYEMYMTHLNDYPVGGRSGEITGALYCSIATPHVHVELKIDGEYVRPDFLCEESGNIIYTTPTPAQSDGPGPRRR